MFYVFFPGGWSVVLAVIPKSVYAVLCLWVLRAGDTDLTSSTQPESVREGTVSVGKCWARYKRSFVTGDESLQVFSGGAVGSQRFAMSGASMTRHSKTDSKHLQAVLDEWLVFIYTHSVAKIHVGLTGKSWVMASPGRRYTWIQVRSSPLTWVHAGNRCCSQPVSTSDACSKFGARTNHSTRSS